jgi:hypothetical protein
MSASLVPFTVVEGKRAARRQRANPVLAKLSPEAVQVAVMWQVAADLSPTVGAVLYDTIADQVLRKCGALPKFD